EADVIERRRAGEHRSRRDLGRPEGPVVGLWPGDRRADGDRPIVVGGAEPGAGAGAAVAAQVREAAGRAGRGGLGVQDQLRDDALPVVEGGPVGAGVCGVLPDRCQHRGGDAELDAAHVAAAVADAAHDLSLRVRALAGRRAGLAGGTRAIVSAGAVGAIRPGVGGVAALDHLVVPVWGCDVLTTPAPHATWSTRPQRPPRIGMLKVGTVKPGVS